MRAAITAFSLFGGKSLQNIFGINDLGWCIRDKITHNYLKMNHLTENPGQFLMRVPAVVTLSFAALVAKTASNIFNMNE